MPRFAAHPVRINASTAARISFMVEVLESCVAGEGVPD
jgi:hypothetical protein